MSNQPSDEVRAALFEQLTERLRRQGYRHPEVAAAALAARGDARLTVEAMAERLGVKVEFLQAVEAGSVPAAELPDGFL